VLNFSIDLSDTVKEFSLQPSETSDLCSYILDRVCDEYFAKWTELVNTLNTSRDEYKRGMYSERPDDHTAIIGLTGRDSKLAMMVESGASSFDEKDGFSNSSKRVIKSDGKGWYLTIPFRHGTSDAIMSEMVPDYKISVLDLMKAGETLGQADLPVGFNEVNTNRIELNGGSLITYKHKSPIYEGMHRRDISSTEKEKRGGYFTFRRVSDKSDDQSWFHPGIEAHNFMDKALAEAQLDLTVDNAVQDWLDVKLG